MWIYLVTNTINGRQYVGKTTDKYICRRWGNHLAAARKGHPTYLARAIRKYGPDKFERTHIAQFDNNEQLSLAEQLFIKEIGTRAPAGYNLTDGGDGTVGRFHNEETRARIRANHPRNWRGKKHSEETKAKMRAAALGRKRNELGAFV